MNEGESSLINFSKDTSPERMKYRNWLNTREVFEELHDWKLQE